MAEHGASARRSLRILCRSLLIRPQSRLSGLRSNGYVMLGVGLLLVGLVTTAETQAEEPNGYVPGSRSMTTGRLQRLKVVRRPFTEYTRFLFAWAIPGNVEAGEDYRILDLTEKSLD